MWEHRLQTLAEVQAHKSNLENQIEQLARQRKVLYRQKQEPERAAREEQIQKLTKQIKAQGQTDRKKASARNPQGPELRVPEKGSMTYDKRPSVRMKIDHYRAVAKAISETQKALQKGTKEAVTKEAR